MHPTTPWMMVAFSLAATAGCDIKMLKPLVAGFVDAHQQECVEAALRGEPDASSVPGAFDRFTAGCDAGDPAMCSALGVMYEMGRNVKADRARAFALYDGACKAGNDAGCVNSGLAYLNGVGAEADVHRAAALFRLGCDGGNDRGCTELATLYKVGSGLPQDPQAAATLFQTSCENGHADSCYRLGGMFDEEMLGPDPMTTLTLYEKACAFGSKRGCERVDALYAQMRQSRPRHPSERCPGGANCTPNGVAASVH